MSSIFLKSALILSNSLCITGSVLPYIALCIFFSISLFFASIAVSLRSNWFLVWVLQFASFLIPVSLSFSSSSYFFFKKISLLDLSMKFVTLFVISSLEFLSTMKVNSASSFFFWGAGKGFSFKASYKYFLILSVPCSGEFTIGHIWNVTAPTL